MGRDWDLPWALHRNCSPQSRHQPCSQRSRGKADGITKDAQVETLVGARVVCAGVGTMNGARAGFHVRGRGGGGNDTNCRLDGDIDGPN